MEKLLTPLKHWFWLLYKVSRILGRVMSLFIMVIIIIWIIYYFIKPDFPPQEVREVLGEFLPGLSQILQDLIPESVFNFLEIQIDTYSNEPIQSSAIQE